MDHMTYHEKTNIANTQKLRLILSELPAFAKDYFRAKESTTSSRTRISYAYDLKIFFEYLIKFMEMKKDGEN